MQAQRFSKEQLKEIMREGAKEFLKQVIPDSMLTVLSGHPSKLTFTPSQWDQVIEFLRESLKQDRTPFIQFSYKPDNLPNTQLRLVNGYVRKDNVKYLPLMLNKAWSDINVYDMSMTLESK